jgi:hypothetical protein
VAGRTQEPKNAAQVGLVLINERSPRLRMRRSDCLARSSQASANLSICALSAAEAAPRASSANSTAFLLYRSSLVMGASFWKAPLNAGTRIRSTLVYGGVLTRGNESPRR